MGLNVMIFVFWMLSFKPVFSLSSFTFIKRLFSSTSLSAVTVVSSAYLRVLIFLLAGLIPTYASSTLEFQTMYSACKLNKRGDNIQPWHTPFPILNQSLVPCPVLTVASWPALRFRRRQVTWSGIVHICCDPHNQRLSCNQWSRNKCLSGILLLFLWSNICWQFDLWFFSKSSLNIWEFLIHIQLKPSLEDFEDYFASMWGFPGGSAGNESTCNAGDLGSIPRLWRSPGEGKPLTPAFWPRTSHGLYNPGGCKELGTTEWLSLASMWNEWNCMVVWTYFDIAFLWDWNENWPFPVLWPLLIFPNLLA